MAGIIAKNHFPRVPFTCDYCGKEYTVDRTKARKIEKQRKHYCRNACRLSGLNGGQIKHKN